MAKYFFLTMLILLAISVDAHSVTEYDNILSELKNYDAQLNKLTISIRENEVGWGLEIFRSTQTEEFQKDYLKLKHKLDPIISLFIQDIRERQHKLKTMGQVLSSVPTLVSDMLTVTDYETRLNHIEFLILSRRTTIASRLSIFIAFVFGIFGVFLGILSIYSNANIQKRFKENNHQFRELFSIIKELYKIVPRRFWLRYKKRRIHKR